MFKITRKFGACVCRAAKPVLPSVSSYTPWRKPLRASSSGGKQISVVGETEKERRVNKYEEEEEDDDEYTEELSKEYHLSRTAHVQTIKSENRDPYPHKIELTHTLAEYTEQYLGLENGKSVPACVCTVSGRVSSIRKASRKLLFYDIHSDGVKVQVMATLKSYADCDDFYYMAATIKRGDVIGVVGYPARTKLGELSIVPKSLQLLSPCLHLIPSSFYGLKNKDLRYRRRYLDMIVNNDVRTKLLLRGKVNKYLRQFFDERGFHEVETPILNTVAAGAAARPFSTFHNQMDSQLYMRVSPELHLKMLVIGGLDRVYEIGKSFRNEGVDKSHNPEFSMCEAYQAYADYNDLMEMTETLMSGLARDLHGPTSMKMTYHPRGSDPDTRYEIDFAPPYRRVDMMQELERTTGTQFPREDRLHTEHARDEVDAICRRMNVECPAPRSTARMLDKLCDRFIIDGCINPTFVMHHPRVMSPLAKEHRSRPGLTERFELFVAGMEVCNAYTELNDPSVQRESFTQQEERRTEGDDEAQQSDEEFCVALEYGLPPTAGWGLGIDRLLMLLSDSSSIREILFFPAMKSEN